MTFPPNPIIPVRVAPIVFLLISHLDSSDLLGLFLRSSKSSFFIFSQNFNLFIFLSNFYVFCLFLGQIIGKGQKIALVRSGHGDFFISFAQNLRILLRIESFEVLGKAGIGSIAKIGAGRYRAKISRPVIRVGGWVVGWDLAGFVVWR